VQFLLGLREFVSLLERAEAGLLSVLRQMRLMGGHPYVNNTDPILAKFVGFAIDSRPRTAQPLMALAATPVDEADPKLLEPKSTTTC
jgi:hypothetical protein